MRDWLTLLLILAAVPSGAGLAGGLLPGQVLFTYSSSEQRIETSELGIVLEFLGDETLLQYQLSIRDGGSGFRVVDIHDQPVPFEPKLVALNSSYYCGQTIVFVTLRYPIPPTADIRQHLFETHAFSRGSLDYLGTFDAPFDGLAPHEAGLDLGFEYTNPQPFMVFCIPEDGVGAMAFRPNDRQ